jgi:peptidoglycan/LPS O-acetylase OafA/YrhL
VHRATAGTLTQSFRTDLRADSLLVGCALALFAARGVRPGRRLATLWGWVGGVALLGIAMLPGSAGWLEHSSLMYRGGFTAVALLGAGLVAAAVHAPSRLLLSRPVVYVGKVSYGLYLWHFPIAVVAAEAFGNGFGNATGFFTGLGLYATSLGLGLLVASLSYRYVEAPLRRARLQRRVAAVAAAA